MHKKHLELVGSLAGLGQTQKYVLALIRQHKRLSRAQLAEKCHVSAPAITKITKELIDKGLIDSVGKEKNARGQPSTLLSISANGAYAMGLHIEYDWFVLVIIDFQGNIVFRERVDGDFKSPEGGLQSIFQFVNKVLSEHKAIAQKTLGMGIAFSANFSIDGHVLIPRAEMGEWGEMDIHKVFSDAFDFPVFVENDASAAALGECLSRASAQHNTFFYLFLGMGIGGAYIYQGKLMRGTNGNAGEIGRLCPHEQSRLSINGLSRAVKLPVEQLTGARITQMFDDKDATFFSWLDGAVENMVPPVNAILHFFDPQSIIISSCFPDKVSEYILAGIRLHPLDERYESVPLPQLEMATIKYDLAISYGAASITFNRLNV